MWGPVAVGFIELSEKFEQGISVANWCLGCLNSIVGYHCLCASSSLRFNFWYFLWSASHRDRICPSLRPLVGVGICYPQLQHHELSCALLLLLLKAEINLDSGNTALLGQLLQRILAVMWSNGKGWRNSQGSEIHSCETCQNVWLLQRGRLLQAFNGWQIPSAQTFTPSENSWRRPYGRYSLDYQLVLWRTATTPRSCSGHIQKLSVLQEDYRPPLGTLDGQLPASWPHGITLNS